MDKMDSARLRSLIDEHLTSSNVYSDIRKFVAGFATDDIEHDNIVDALQSKGVIDDIIASINQKSSLKSDPAAEQQARRRFLHLKILGGSAFVDHERHPGDVGGYELHVHFRNQRLRSKTVESSIEPAFNDSFLLELQVGKSAMALLQMEDAPLHLVLLRVTHVDDDTGGHCKRELVATHKVEWRKAVGRGGVSLPVQLTAAGAEAKMNHTVGLLQLRLDLLPPANHGQAVSMSEIRQQLQLEAARHADVQQHFYNYARRWWKEYAGVKKAFKHRLVKIFAENEKGEHRSVCTFIQPLQAGRLLDTPRHAARFVGLIPFERVDAVGGGREETWNSLHTFLALRKSDCENHAILLTSLLLGFGLNAYMCVGTADRGEGERDHVWVMTRNESSDSSADSGVLFWESTSGKRISPRKPQSNNQFQYLTIACVFSHQEFYANLQVDDRVEHCQFSLGDSALWKAMNPQILSQLPHEPVPPLAPTFSALDADEIEDILRGLVREYRRQQKLTTSWDDELSFRLGPALAAYELERAVGISYGSEEFQSTIKRVVPSGHCFKGYPAVFTHGSPYRMMATLKQGQVPTDILEG